MKLRLVLAALLAASTYSTATQAATFSATCNTIDSALLAAKPGDTVSLVGHCGEVKLPSRVNPVPITIDASLARLHALVAHDTTGWRWQGGTFFSPHSKFRAIMISDAHRIEVVGPQIKQTLTGVYIGRGSSKITIRKATIRGIGADGINIDSASDVLIEGCDIAQFQTIKTIHADAIQMWGETRNVTISGNTIHGKAQGITSFGPGVVAGLRVLDNAITVQSPWAISLQEEADAVVMRNSAWPLDPKNKWAPAWSWHPRIWTHPSAIRKDNRMNGKVVTSAQPPATGPGSGAGGGSKPKLW